jgi:hypothetical protein
MAGFTNGVVADIRTAVGAVGEVVVWPMGKAAAAAGPLAAIE